MPCSTAQLHKKKGPWRDGLRRQGMPRSKGGLAPNG